MCRYSAIPVVHDYGQELSSSASTAASLQVTPARQMSSKAVSIIPRKPARGNQERRGNVAQPETILSKRHRNSIFSSLICESNIDWTKKKLKVLEFMTILSITGTTLDNPQSNGYKFAEPKMPRGTQIHYNK